MITVRFALVHILVKGTFYLATKAIDRCMMEENINKNSEEDPVESEEIGQADDLDMPTLEPDTNADEEAEEEAEEIEIVV